MITKSSRKAIATKLDFLYHMRDMCDDEHGICVSDEFMEYENMIKGIESMLSVLGYVNDPDVYGRSKIVKRR